MEKCIDISRHQTSFDPSICKKEGITTVICRLAYGASKDIKSNEYLSSAKECGLNIGGYGFGTWHYKSKCNSNLDTARELMKQQVSAWIDIAKENKCNSWIAIDQEIERGQAMGLSIGDNTALLCEAAQMIENAGFSVCLYASASWAMANVNLTKFTYPLWVAYYRWYGSNVDFSTAEETFPSNNGLYGKWMNENKDRICMWQFTSEGYADKYGCAHGSNNLDKNWIYFSPIKKTEDNSVSYISPTRLSNGDVLLMWPVVNHRITAGWTYSNGSAHGALDFGVVEGSAVIAADDGVIDLVQRWDGKTITGMQSYGNLIRIKHSDYNNKVLQTYYAHLKTILVENGQNVKAGDVIGYSGSTGNSTGPHLHFEVRLAGVRRNPLNWLDDDFYKAYDYVKLGDYKSVVRPIDESKKSYTLKIGPMSYGDYITIKDQCEQLNIKIELL